DNPPVNIVHISRQSREGGNDDSTHNALRNIFKNLFHHGTRRNCFRRDTLFFAYFHALKTIAPRQAHQTALVLHRIIVHLILCADSHINDGHFANVHAVLRSTLSFVSDWILLESGLWAPYSFR